MVGCGNFARRQLLPIIRSSNVLDLRAVCDTDPEVAAGTAEQFTARSWTTKLHDILEDESIEAVFIAVRDHLQASLAQQAMAHSKHVYVEKPVALNSRDFISTIAQRDSAGVQVAVGFNKRFSPAYQQARKAIVKGGGAKQLFLRMSDDAWRWAIGYEPGSLIRHDACHLFDLAPWLVGSPVENVFGFRARPDDETILLNHWNGAVTTIINSGNASLDFPKERMEGICERGSVTVDDYVELRAFGTCDSKLSTTFRGVAQSSTDKRWVEAMGARGIDGMLDVRQKVYRDWLQSGDKQPSCLPNFIRDQGWQHSVEGFARSLLEKEHLTHATIEDAYRASAIAEAALESFESGQVVQPKEMTC